MFTEHETLDTGAGKDFVSTAIVHRVIRVLSTTLYRLWKWRCLAPFRRFLGIFENVQQRTWDHIPNRDCMWDSQKKDKKRFTSFFFLTFLVVMRHTCQVTNQSSHGELSFHHNPHLLLRRDLCLSTFRVIRRGGTRLKNAAHPSYCHCCELCALKQKPGVLLENVLFFTKTTKYPNPNCKPYSSPHQVPKH